MGIRAGVDQLHVDPHFAGRLLHRAFQHVSDPELLRDGLQVFRLTLVSRRRGARNHFQVGDARQFRQNFVLDTLGK